MLTPQVIGVSDTFVDFDPVVFDPILGPPFTLDPIMGRTSNFRKPSPLYKQVGPSDLEDDGAKNINVTEHFGLKNIYVQVKAGGDPSTERIYIAEDGGFTAQGIEVLNTYNVTDVNRNGYPVTTTDVKGLVTKINYTPSKWLEYEDCIDDRDVRSQIAIFSVAPGQPESITVGYGLPDALTTNYTYNANHTVESITDPNGVTAVYEYDNFLRPQKVKRGEETVLTEYEYANVKHNASLFNAYDYRSLSLDNYVKSTNHLTTGSFNTSTKYISPLGRESGVATTYEGGVGASGGHLSGVPYYDLYGRVTASVPIGNPGTPFLYSDGGADKVKQAFAAAPRGEVKKVARQMLDLESGPNKSMTVCAVSESFLEADLASAGNPTALDYLPGLGQLIQEHVIDEDGKQYRTYS
ncbi:MAG: hypothetical protein AAF597_15325, partial [Bacteroidota bacterium]